MHVTCLSNHKIVFFVYLVLHLLDASLEGLAKPKLLKKAGVLLAKRLPLQIVNIGVKECLLVQRALGLVWERLTSF